MLMDENNRHTGKDIIKALILGSIFGLCSGASLTVALMADYGLITAPVWKIAIINTFVLVFILAPLIRKLLRKHGVSRKRKQEHHLKK